MNKKEKLIKRLRGLKQNKSLTDAQIEEIVSKKIDAEELRTAFCGLKEEEIDKAVDIYQQYMEQHSFESLAEKSTLVGMIYKEALIDRIKNFMKKEDETKDGAIPLHMAEKMMELSAQVLSDKEKLGMLNLKETDSFTSAWKELQEKAVNYYNEHGGEIYYQCPECKEFSRQVMQIDGFDIVKATFFKHSTLYNRPLFKLYHEKKVTKEEVAEILGVHHKYVTFLYDGLFLKELKDASKN